MKKRKRGRPRKPGRPKGSKNKSKTLVLAAPALPSDAVMRELPPDMTISVRFIDQGTFAAAWLFLGRRRTIWLSDFLIWLRSSYGGIPEKGGR